MHPRFARAAIALAFLFLAPVSSGLTIAIAEVEAPLQIGGQGQRVDVTVSIDCMEETLAALTVPSTSISIPMGGFSDTLTVLGPGSIVFACPTYSETPEKTVTYEIYPRSDAEAYEDHSFSVYVDAPSGNQSATQTATVGPTMIMTATMVERLVERAGNGEYVSHVKLQNLGNTPIQVEVEVLEGPPQATATMDPLTLQRFEEQTTEVRWTMPPSSNQNGNYLNFSFVPTSLVGDTGPGVKTSVTLVETVTNQAAKQTPAPIGVFLVGLLALGRARKFHDTPNRA